MTDQQHDEATVQRCIDAVWNDDGLSVRLHRSEIERIVRTVLSASRQPTPTAPKPAVPTDLTAPGPDNAAGAAGTTP